MISRNESREAVLNSDFPRRRMYYYYGQLEGGTMNNQVFIAWRIDFVNRDSQLGTTSMNDFVVVYRSLCAEVFTIHHIATGA